MKRGEKKVLITKQIYAWQTVTFQNQRFVLWNYMKTFFQYVCTFKKGENVVFLDQSVKKAEAFEMYIFFTWTKLIEYCFFFLCLWIFDQSNMFGFYGWNDYVCVRICLLLIWCIHRLMWFWHKYTAKNVC